MKVRPVANVNLLGQLFCYFLVSLNKRGSECPLRVELVCPCHPLGDRDLEHLTTSWQPQVSFCGVKRARRTFAAFPDKAREIHMNRGDGDGPFGRFDSARAMNDVELMP